MGKSSIRSKAYTEAGVDINAGNDLVQRIKSMVAKTHNKSVLSDIGGFGGLFRPDIENTNNPVLVASTDGVGTKLKLAFEYNAHETIGIDLVAMSVNDILVQGAKPLFFLDYFATGKLNVDTAAAVISGIAEGCKQAGCALLGGETAEMPDMYSPGEYDLAGFCVGMVSNAEIVDGSSIKVGDSIIGVASSGVHANGYSLVRKVLKKSKLKGDDIFPGTDKKTKDVLLEPTIIYVDAVRNIMRDFKINGMVHVTGGGFYDNIPRVLPATVKAKINFGSWSMPAVFDWLKAEGSLDWPAMMQIFNCGIGYVMVVNAADTQDIIDRTRAMGLPCWQIGEIELQDKENAEQVDIVF